MMVPEDIQRVFFETLAHRVFFTPVYELRRSEVSAQLMDRILHSIAAP